LSVNYNGTVLTQRLQVVASALDAGGANGVMRLLDAGNGILSSLSLARPAASVTNSVLSFNGLALVDPAAAGTGFATRARCEASDGTVVFSGLTVATVGSSASDIVMSPTNFITAGQTVAITAATITGN
jgi:hypothetical protein